ncbi:MAG TPA: septation protein IspZ [Nevskiaceae bacterium]|nr:septation protein IspZ [Nevskiaceae bacterium]
MKLLDLLPGLLFLAALYLGDIYQATAVLIVSLLALAGLHWWKDGRPHKLHTTAALAALVLGGLTLLLRDSSFVKYKTSVVNGLIAAALLGSHVIGDKVLLARLPQQAIRLPDAVWRRVNLAWAGFFTGIALLNLYVMQHFDDRSWGLFKTFGVSVLMFIFLLAHLPFLSRYLPQDEAAKPGPGA